MDKKLFSERLKEQRIAAGYKTQKAFAQAYNNRYFPNFTYTYGNNMDAGILGTLKNYENPNKEIIPRLEYVDNMCKMLDCDIDYLLGKIDEPKHIYQAMKDLCGLSNAATEQLIYWKTHGGNYTDTLNMLLVSTNFDHVLFHAAELIKAKPIYMGLFEILQNRITETYSTQNLQEGPHDLSSLRESVARYQTKYEIEKLRLNEYLTFLVGELESKAISQKTTTTKTN